ncbi:MAG: hypothetical protein K2M19_06880 [Muribaculaceae bacterium]|nr:hypothetical protein [Muribaculaceae bacterium]
MKQNSDDILSRADHRDGMTVPEGYFEQFTARMTARLPERPELTAPDNRLQPPASLWQRVRPYVYMAAMFAGVWCMLRMFTLMTAENPQPLESNPVIAEALGNDSFVDDYVFGDLNQWDLYDDLMESGFDPDSLVISDSMVPVHD